MLFYFSCFCHCFFFNIFFFFLVSFFFCSFSFNSFYDLNILITCHPEWLKDFSSFCCLSFETLAVVSTQQMTPSFLFSNVYLQSMHRLLRLFTTLQTLQTIPKKIDLKLYFFCCSLAMLYLPFIEPTFALSGLISSSTNNILNSGDISFIGIFTAFHLAMSLEVVPPDLDLGALLATFCFGRPMSFEVVGLAFCFVFCCVTQTLLLLCLWT